MNTKLNALVIEENAAYERSGDQVLSNKGLNASTDLTVEKAVNDSTIDSAPKENSLLKTVGMLIAAPFIALGYVLALPFIGIYQVAKLALEALAKRFPAENGKLNNLRVYLKSIGLFFAAPFVALAYVIALPFVGFVMFSRLAMEARAKNS